MKISQKLQSQIKLVILITLFLFLIFDFVLVIVYPRNNAEGLRVIDSLDIYFAYFTTQSNYIVVFYLFFSYHMKKYFKTRPSLGIEVAITVYISVTMVVFWGGIFSDQNEPQTYKPLHWVSTVMLHMCIPILMITNFIIGCGDYHVNLKDYAKFSMIATLIYPTLYSVYIMIRGYYRFQAFGPDFFVNSFWQETNQSGQLVWNSIWFESGLTQNATPYDSTMFYPYYFLDYNFYEMNYYIDPIKVENIIGKNLYQIHDIETINNLKEGMQTAFSNDKSLTVRVLQLVSSSVTIFGLLIGFQFGYLLYNNSKYNRWHNLEGEVLNKEEHASKMLVIKFVKLGRKSEKRINKIQKLQEYKLAKSQWKKMSGEEKENRKQSYFEEIKRTKNEIKQAKKFQKFVHNGEKSALKKYLATISPDMRDKVKEKVFNDWRIKKELKKLGQNKEEIDQGF